MSVSDGEKVNAAITNAAYISRLTDSNTIAKVDLDNTDPLSGSSVPNIQKAHNGAASFSGSDANGAEDQKPSWNSDAIGVANEDVKSRVDSVQAQVSTNITDIATNASDISANTSDIGDIRTTTGTADGDVDMGVYASATITDAQSTKQNIIDAAAQIDQNASDISDLENQPVFTFKGNWNASTNTPTLINGTGTVGDAYKVSVAGTHDFGAGNITFIVGDLVYYDGAVWDKDKELVQSVAGKTGVVLLDTDDVTEATNLYYTESRVTANVSVAANTAKVSADGSIDTHSDVDTTTIAPTNGQALLWDNPNSEWRPGDVATGSSSVGVNFITNPDFETDVSDWTSYKDAPSPEPVDGIGAVSTLVFDRITTSTQVLSGTGSARLLSGVGVNRQGEGVSTDIVIDNEYLNKEIIVRLSNTGSSNTLSGEYKIFAYDIDNSILIGALSNDDDGDIITGGLDATNLITENSRSFVGTFLATDSLNYRIIIHCTTTDTSRSKVIYFDTVSAGPDTFGPGVVAGESIRYTKNDLQSIPNIAGTVIGYDVKDFDDSGYVTGTGVNWKYTSRITGKLKINASILMTQTNTWIPSVEEFQIRIEKNATIHSIGSRVDYLPAATNVFATSQVNDIVSVVPGDIITITVLQSSGAALTTHSNPFFNYVDITEQTSQGNLISTQEANYSIVKARYTSVSVAAIPNAATVFDFASKQYDTHNAVTIGAGWNFKAPRAGYYTVSSSIPVVSGAPLTRVDIAIRINGVSQIPLFITLPSVTAGTSTVTDTLLLEKDDLIDIVNHEVINSGTYTAAQVITIIEDPDFKTFGVYKVNDNVQSSSGRVNYTILVNEWGSLTSIDLDTGIWDIRSFIIYYSNGATTTTNIHNGISSVDGNVSPGGIGTNMTIGLKSTVVGSNDTLSFFDDNVIVNNPTTYYLKAAVNGATTDLQVAYKISARRI